VAFNHLASTSFGTLLCVVPTTALSAQPPLVVCRTNDQQADYITPKKEEELLAEGPRREPALMVVP